MPNAHRCMQLFRVHPEFVGVRVLMIELIYDGTDRIKTVILTTGSKSALP